MKTIGISILLLGLSNVLFAQGIQAGIKLGTGGSYILTQEVATSNSFERFPLNMIVAGVYAEKAMSQNLIVGAELLYQRNGGKDIETFQRPDLGNGQVAVLERADRRRIFSMVSLPLYAQYSSNYFNFRAGPQINFIMDGDIDIDAVVGQGVAQFDNDSNGNIRGPNVDYGLTAGVSYCNCINREFSVEVLLYYGLNDLSDSEKSNMLNITAGIKMAIFKE